jgi:hypothetical protein
MDQALSAQEFHELVSMYPHVLKSLQLIEPGLQRMPDHDTIRRIQRQLLLLFQQRETEVQKAVHDAQSRQVLQYEEEKEKKEYHPDDLRRVYNILRENLHQKHLMITAGLQKPHLNRMAIIDRYLQLSTRRQYELSQAPYVPF